MIAARIHRFGGPDVIEIDDLPRPPPLAGELVVRAAAAGVGPWDALIRDGKTTVAPPLILGAEFAGVVDALGSGVSARRVPGRVRQVRRSKAQHAEFCRERFGSGRSGDGLADAV